MPVKVLDCDPVGDCDEVCLCEGVVDWDADFRTPLGEPDDVPETEAVREADSDTPRVALKEELLV